MRSRESRASTSRAHAWANQWRSGTAIVLERQYDSASSTEDDEVIFFDNDCFTRARAGPSVAAI
jgi:hypothetical protein